MKNEDYEVGTDEEIENLKHSDEIKEIAKALRYENLEEVTENNYLMNFATRLILKQCMEVVYMHV